MAEDIPTQVASVVEDSELGALVGRFPQASNRIQFVLYRWCGGLIGIGSLVSIFNGLTRGNVPGVMAVIPLLAISVWLVVQGERIRRNRAFYLYREGVVVTNSSGRIGSSARWEDLQLYWEIRRTGRADAPGPQRDLYRLVEDGRTLLRHGELRDSGPGRIMRDLASTRRTPVLLRNLRAGEEVPFGPLAATPSGLVYRSETMPWTTIDEIGIGEYAASVQVQGRRTIQIRTAKVPDILALIHIASSAKTSPGWSSEDE